MQVQMTAHQEAKWSTDPSLYVAEDDVDMFGARGSCAMLLSVLQVRPPAASCLYDARNKCARKGSDAALVSVSNVALDDEHKATRLYDLLALQETHEERVSAIMNTVVPQRLLEADKARAAGSDE